MAYIGKHPRFEGTILTDQVATSVTAPASGSHKIVNRNGKLYMVDSSGAETVVGDAGAGEKNYIENPSAQAAITGWTAVGDLDVARSTTAAELPREYTTATGIKITADANTQSTADYVYYDFTLDDVDLSKKLKIQWSQKTTGTYNAGDLAVVITTQADRTTALHTPVTTAIPATDGVFITSFDASTTATLSLVIRATTDMTTDGGIVISDVIVGPGVITQGAVVGEWTSFTPTGSWSANTTYTGKYRRVGDSMEIQYYLALSGAPTSASLTVNMPSGFTINTSALALASNSNFTLGQGLARDAGAQRYVCRLGYSSTSALSVHLLDANTTYARNDDAVNATTPITFASGDEIVLRTIAIPIAEWAGSGTVAQNMVEYASSTTGTWDAAASATDTVYGPDGAVISGSLTADRTKRVRFQTPIQATDNIILQLQGANSQWINVGQTYGSFVPMPAVDFGCRWVGVSGSTTDIDVIFQRYYAQGTTYNSTVGASSWNSSITARWRLVKASAGVPVGFGLADTSGNAGLVAPYTAGSGVVYGGTYTPTIGAGSNINVAASTYYSCMYSRVGKIVTVSGLVTVDPTAAGTGTRLSISLPIASNFSSSLQCRGSGAAITNVGNAAAGIYGDNTNDVALLEFYDATSHASRDYSFTFQYEII